MTKVVTVSVVVPPEVTLLLAAVKVPSVVAGVGTILKLMDLLTVPVVATKLAVAVEAPAAPGTSTICATPLPLVKAVPVDGMVVATLEGVTKETMALEAKPVVSVAVATNL